MACSIVSIFKSERKLFKMKKRKGIFNLIKKSDCKAQLIARFIIKYLQALALYLKLLKATESL